MPFAELQARIFHFNSGIKPLPEQEAGVGPVQRVNVQAGRPALQ